MVIIILCAAERSRRVRACRCVSVKQPLRPSRRIATRGRASAGNTVRINLASQRCVLPRAQRSDDRATTAAAAPNGRGTRRGAVRNTVDRQEQNAAAATTVIPLLTRARRWAASSMCAALLYSSAPPSRSHTSVSRKENTRRRRRPFPRPALCKIDRRTKPNRPPRPLPPSFASSSRLRSDDADRARQKLSSWNTSRFPTPNRIRNASPSNPADHLHNRGTQKHTAPGTAARCPSRIALCLSLCIIPDP